MKELSMKCNFSLKRVTEKCKHKQNMPLCLQNFKMQFLVQLQATPVHVHAPDYSVAIYSFKINYRNTRTMSLTSFCLSLFVNLEHVYTMFRHCFIYYLLHFSPLFCLYKYKNSCYGVSIVDFEQVNAGQVFSYKNFGQSLAVELGTA